MNTQKNVQTCLINFCSNLVNGVCRIGICILHVNFKVKCQNNSDISENDHVCQRNLPP